MAQVMAAFDLARNWQPLTLCLECNQPLAAKAPEEVEGRVPPYVFKTQTQYMECPACRRIYWRGTHWEAMMRKIGRLTDANGEYHEEVMP